MTAESLEREIKSKTSRQSVTIIRQNMIKATAWGMTNSDLGVPVPQLENVTQATGEAIVLEQVHSTIFTRLLFWGGVEDKVGFVPLQ